MVDLAHQIVRESSPIRWWRTRSTALRRSVALLVWIGATGFWSRALIRSFAPSWPHLVPFAYTTHNFNRFLIFVDLRDRVRDAQMFLHGANPYAGAHPLSNTPPSVAVLHLPISALGADAGTLAALWVTVASLAVASAALWSAVSTVPRTMSLMICSVVVAPSLIVWWRPTWSLVLLGQDQAWFLALVVVDLFVISRRRTGWLVGAVAALSLWPATFLAATFSLARWRGLVRALLGAVAVTALGFLGSWRSSSSYWFHLLPSGGLTKPAYNLTAINQLNGIGAIRNMSLHGTLGRQPFGGFLSSQAAYFLVGLAVISLSLWIAWGLYRLDLRVCALTALTTGTVLTAPFSWDHHWTWVIVMLPFAAWECRRTGTISSLILVGTWLLFSRWVFIRSYASIPGLGHRTVNLSSPWPFVVSSLYVLLGLVIVTTLGVMVLQSTRKSSAVREISLASS